MNPSNENLSDHAEIDLRMLLTILWSGRWWVIGGVVSFSAAATLAAFLMTPVYRATTVMVPVDSEGSGLGALSSALTQFGGLTSLAGIGLGSSSSSTEESLAVLRSREFTENFIRDQGLMPELFQDRWDETANRWIGNVDDQPTLAQADKYFDQQIRAISQDTRNGLITLGIEWRDRDKAALWANELVTRLNAEMRSRAINYTNASIGYLEKELAATTTVDTRAAISRLMEAQINQRMFANVTQEYAFRVVDRALPPDPNDVVRPKKLLMLVMGSALGFFVGVLAVFLFRRTV